MERLVPTQIGVSVPGACETTAMALQNWVSAHVNDATWAILQVDVRNAFNNIDREAMLKAVAEEIPELVEWVKFCYAAHSHLFLANGHPLTSEQGVQH